FAPFTLLAPALALAGLPAASRALAHSEKSAALLAVKLSSLCVGVTIAYSALMLVAGTRILTAVFGSSFDSYGDLVVPMAAWQIMLAVGVGFGILLDAERRGRAIVVVGSTAMAVSFAASTILATVAGVRGAVWGLAAGAAA